jgi:hypothetical protein
LGTEDKRPGLEVDHSPQSNAEVNNEWDNTSILLYTFIALHWESFTFFFYFQRCMTVWCDAVSLEQGFPDILKDRSSFISSGNDNLDCLTLKMKVVRFSETSVNMCPKTQFLMPEDLNL